jgi:chromosome segregation ATPase
MPTQPTRAELIRDRDAVQHQIASIESHMRAYRLQSNEALNKARELEPQLRASRNELLQINDQLNGWKRPGI